MSRAFTPTVGGVYSLGRGDGVTILDGGFIESDILNTQDLATINSPDFVPLGAGSQVWYVGYGIRVSFPANAPTDHTGLVLQVLGSTDFINPFSFFPEQEIRLPLSGTVALPLQAAYSGQARVEWSAVRFDLTNNVGQSLVLSFQFWAKAF